VSRTRGAVLVLLTGVVFSFGAVPFRATDDIGAWEYLVSRAVGALVVTIPVFVFQNRGRVRDEIRAISMPHLGAGVIIGLMFCSFIVALSETTAAFILFFQALSPVAAAICSWFLLRERMSRDAWLATVGAIVGVGVIISGGVGSAAVWVIPIVIFIPIGFGFYTTMIRMGDDIDPSVPVIVAGITALGLSLGATVINGGFHANSHDHLLALFAGIFLLGLPLPLFNWANRAVPAPDATLLLMSEVVLAPVWVWIFYEENPSSSTLTGGAVILASVVWLTLRSAQGARRLRTSRG
jgi:DME family drug/metabolite transporter